MPRPGWRIAVFSLVLLAVLAWTVWPLKPFQDCIRDRKNHQPYQALHEEHFLIVKAKVRLRLNLACFVHAAEQYQTAFIVLSGVLVAGFTGTLWKDTNRLWKSAESALDAQREANALSRESLAASQRAWLRPEVGIIAPLVYDPRGDTPLKISFSIVIENLGKSTATRVVLGRELIIQHAADTTHDDVRASQRRLAAKTKEQPTTSFEGVIFPGGKELQQWGMSISRTRFDDIAAKHWAMVDGAADLLDEGTDPTDEEAFAITPVFIGCVDYEFPFGSAHHQTWFAYEVVLRPGYAIVLEEEAMAIPMDDLMLREVWISMKHAD